MVDQVDVKKISPDSRFQRELSTVGNGDSIIERKEVDSDGDGYLDCRHYRNQTQFTEWQNELFKVGLIHRLQPVFKCKDGQKIPLEFDYVKIETIRNPPRIFAYFSDRLRATSFQTSIRLMNEKVVEVGASSVERTDSTPRDNVDTNRLIPDNFNDFVDDVNKPEKGLSGDGHYYRIDITNYIGLPANRLTVFNRKGRENANCFNAALYFSGVTDKLGEVYERELFPILDNSKIFQAADTSKHGDLVVWYRYVQGNKIPIHAFIDIGHGWMMTKNGNGDDRPYQFQRIEHARHLYSQKRIDGNIGIVHLKEARYRPLTTGKKYLDTHPELLHLIPSHK